MTKWDSYARSACSDCRCPMVRIPGLRRFLTRSGSSRASAFGKINQAACHLAPLS
jgi:hypothetical protein